MKKNVSNLSMKKYYLSEFSLYDSDHFITFNILEINILKSEITVAITNQGGITVETFDLITTDGLMYFEYGIYSEKIALNNFDNLIN